MGLTQISTDGVKDNAITKTKIPADQIEASELANNSVDTNAIINDAVTADKLANTSVTAGSYTNTNITVDAQGRITSASNGTNSQVRAAVEAASDSNVFTDADHSKLNAIEAGATADQTDAEIRTAVENASDSNVFTDADHNKLNGIEAGATADQTNAEIKTAYEANSNTNAFTDTEKTKLSSVETNADVTDATNVDAAGAVMNSDLNGKGELLVGDGSGDPTALSVGQNGYILTADSTEATGVKWAANSGGGGGSGISDVVSDTTPQLGGNLDVQTNEITTSTTNGNVKLNPNGTGVVEIKGDGSSADGTLQLNCSQNSHGIKLKSPPHSAGASYTFTFPQNIQNGQFLTTDANGNTSWSAINLSSLNASNLTSGTIPDARFPATLPAASAANLTNLNAANLQGSLPNLGFVLADTTPQLGGDLQSNGNDIDFADSDKAVFGSDSDMQMYHDGSSAAILNDTGQLTISSDDALNLTSRTAQEYLFRGFANGAVNLYYDFSTYNTPKLATTATGITVDGACVATSFSGNGANLTNLSATNRNILINGSCAISQRGTSFSGTGFTLDRWYVGSSDYTVDQVTDAPSNSGLTHSFRVSRSGSTTGYVTFQMIELPKTGQAGQFYNGAKFTLSGYVKGTSGNTIIPTLRFSTGTGGSSGSSFTRTEGAFTCNGSWQPFTFHFTVDENVGGSDKCVESYFSIVTNSTGQQTFLTGLQLESGENATPFDHRQIAEELALCERYFYAYRPSSNMWRDGYTDGNIYVAGRVKFPVTMRSAPSVTKRGTFQHDNNETNNVAAETPNCNAHEATSIVRGASAGRTYSFWNASGTYGFDFSAEL